MLEQSSWLLLALSYAAQLHVYHQDHHVYVTSCCQSETPWKADALYLTQDWDTFGLYSTALSCISNLAWS